MKSMIIAIVAAVIATNAARGQETTNAFVTDTWIAYEAVAQKDDMLGSVKWESLTFSTNSTVSWRWVRDGKSEHHAGRFEIVPDREPPIWSRLRFNIVITPNTLAVRRPIVLRNYYVCHDNRFLQAWTVLKWGMGSGNVTTCLREKDATTLKLTKDEKWANQVPEDTARKLADPQH